MSVETLWSIGDFSRRTGLTPKALRLYDELGLLVPAEVDPQSGYRRYADAQLGRAQVVATLRLVGMPLARIRALLDLPPGAAAEEIVAYWRQVEADTSSRRQIVASLVRQLRNEEHTMPDQTGSLTAQLGVSHHQGARERQQDAVLARPDLIAVADGFGDRDDLAERALAAFAASGWRRPPPRRSPAARTREPRSQPFGSRAPGLTSPTSATPASIWCGPVG